MAERGSLDVSGVTHDKEMMTNHVIVFFSYSCSSIVHLILSENRFLHKLPTVLALAEIFMLVPGKPFHAAASHGTAEEMLTS